MICCFLLSTFSFVLWGQNSDQKFLIKHGYRTDLDGLLEIITIKKKTPEDEAKINKNIELLDHRDWKVRWKAMKTLKSFGKIVLESVKKGMKGKNPAIRYGCRKIFNFHMKERKALFLATIRLLEKKKNPKTIPALIKFACAMGDAQIENYIRRVVYSISNQSCLEILLKQCEDEEPIARNIASFALGNLECDLKACEKLEKMGKNPVYEVRFSAGYTLLKWKKKQGIPIFIELLKEKDNKLHSYVTHILCLYAKGKKGKDYLDWRKWWKRNKNSYEVPLKISARSHLFGNILLAYGYRGRVEELDPSGKVIWKFHASGVWAAEKLMNGNVLIAAYSENRVLEVDKAGKIVWQYRPINCLNARPLANGNILVADYSGRKVVEISRDKKEIWSYQTDSYCSDAIRLVDGNTLVCSRRKIFKVSPEKKVLWKWEGGSEIYGIQMLESGNILAADFGQRRVYELTPDKKIVWQYRGGMVSDVFRLPNGNTLITNDRCFQEVTYDKKVIWEVNGCNYGSARK